ncbi:MAG: hypothetical protein V3T05_05040 [Myxococcota bacterium]
MQSAITADTVRVGLVITALAASWLSTTSGTAKTLEQDLAEIGELVTPDTHYEWGAGADGGRFVLAIPFPFALPPVKLFERSSDSRDWVCRGHHLYLLPTLTLEPQRNVTNGDWRMMLGVRAAALQPASGLHILGEGVALVGQDINGVGYGVGVGYGGWLSIVYRRLYTGMGLRHDVGLDFSLFSIPYGRHMNQVRAARDESVCEKRAAADRRFGLLPAPLTGMDASDDEPPTVVHTACDFHLGQNLAVFVELFDASAVLAPTVIFWYPDGGRHSMEMTRIEQSHRFGATLPTARARAPVRYYIEAFDVGGHGPAFSGMPTAPHVARPMADPPECSQ